MRGHHQRGCTLPVTWAVVERAVNSLECPEWEHSPGAAETKHRPKQQRKCSHFPVLCTFPDFLAWINLWIWAELRGFQEFLWGFPGGSVVKNHLPMQETQIWSPVWEDPTCQAATKLMHHNFWAQALEPGSCNKRSHRNEKPTVTRVAPTHCN